MSYWNNKNVMITGSTDGLGLFLTQNLLDFYPKIKIIALGRRNIEDTPLNKYHSDRLTYVKQDMEDIEGLKITIDRIIEQEKYIDVVINNACHFEITNIFNLTYDELLAHYNVNIFSPFIISQKVLDHMNKRNYGRIIMINTESALQTRPEIAAYSSSKAALLNITRSLSQGLIGKDITINSLLLGSLGTPYYVNGYKNEANKNKVDFEEFVQSKLKEFYPATTTGKLTSLITVMNTIEFICKNNNEINGMSWKLDGGSLPIIH